MGFPKIILLNAKSFAEQGFSVVLQEDDITDQLLLQKIQELYENRHTYISAMKASGQLDSIATIVGLIEEAAGH